MPDPLHQIPLAEIDAEALSRDRTLHDAADFDELRLSIARHGLRMPVEVFELAEPEGPPPLRPHLLRMIGVCL
jgi:ParB family chromosome partitioning protein